MTPREALNRHAHVLGSSWESAGTFTNRVGWDLRADYVLIRKNGGTRCSGPGGSIDCDKVMQRQPPYQMYDIVGGAGASGARGIWDEARNHDGSLARGNPSMAVDPEPYDGSEPGPQPGPQPGPTPSPGCHYEADLITQLVSRLGALESRLGPIEERAIAAAHDAHEAAIEAQGIRDRLDKGFRGTAHVRLLGTVTFDLVKKES